MTSGRRPRRASSWAASPACGCLSRVAAEEFRVFNVVPGGVLFGVPDGRRHDLRADDPSGPLRQAQRNGADAAVQVQHRLPAGEAGKFQGLGVQPLGLSPVDLEEGGNGQAESEPAQLLLQPVQLLVADAAAGAAFPGGVQHQKSHAALLIFIKVG